ncbi:MAG: hypothetical protein M1820_007043 [Bogoriella megaspora]|nr:MAG: hypothetical protein M1820_007043 [Bogoriella megaspora]
MPTTDDDPGFTELDENEAHLLDKRVKIPNIPSFTMQKLFTKKTWYQVVHHQKRVKKSDLNRMAEEGYQQIKKNFYKGNNIVSAFHDPKRLVTILTSIPRSKEAFNLINSEKQKMAPTWSHYYPEKPEFDSVGNSLSQYHAEDYGCFEYEKSLKPDEREAMASGSESEGESSDSEGGKKKPRYPKGSMISVYGKFGKSDVAGPKGPCYSRGPGGKTDKERERACQTVLTELGVEFDKRWPSSPPSTPKKGSGSSSPKEGPAGKKGDN